MSCVAPLCCEWQADFVDLSKVTREHLLDATLLLRLLLQRIETLRDKIIKRVSEREFEEPHSVRDEGRTLVQWFVPLSQEPRNWPSPSVAMRRR